ncbi:MAG: glycosyltransferase family 2 protein [Chloroflexota bacterium]
MVDLSVIVVSYNTRELLRRCLRSALAAAETDNVSVELVVIDNGSADGSAAAVREEFPSATLLAFDQNLGFAAASNVGLARANGRYPLLLNPDTEVRPGAFAALVGFMDRHPKVAAVGPSLVYGDGSPQHSCFAFPTVAMQFLDLFPLHHRLLSSRLNGRYPLGRKEPFPVGHPLGACMLIRREALAQIGALDEGFFIYCEEVDWCWRAQKAGWQVYCQPQAVVVHHGAQSTRQFAEKMFVELYRSRYRLMSRHYGRLRLAAARTVILAGVAKLALADRWAAARGRLGKAELQSRLQAYATIARM